MEVVVPALVPVLVLAPVLVLVLALAPGPAEHSPPVTLLSELQLNQVRPALLITYSFSMLPPKNVFLS
jgi:hypothetical protein